MSTDPRLNKLMTLWPYLTPWQRFMIRCVVWRAVTRNWIADILYL